MEMTVSRGHRRHCAQDKSETQCDGRRFWSPCFLRPCKLEWRRGLNLLGPINNWTSNQSPIACVSVSVTWLVSGSGQWLLVGQLNWPSSYSAGVARLGQTLSPCVPDVVVMASSLDQVMPGSTLAVFYSDDVVWHERLVLWRLSPTSWYILTPGLDLYAEDLSCSGRVKVKGTDFKHWSRVGASAYRFANPISDDTTLKGHIRQAFREASQEADFDPSWRPGHVVDSKGVMRDGGSFLFGLFVNKRVAPDHRPGVGGPVEAHASPEQTEAIASVRPISLPGPAQIWLSVENMDGYKLGETVAVNPLRDMMIGEHTGVVKTASGWIKVELIGAGEPVEFMEGRRLAHQRWIAWRCPGFVCGFWCIRSPIQGVKTFHMRDKPRCCTSWSTLTSSVVTPSCGAARSRSQSRSAWNMSWGHWWRSFTLEAPTTSWTWRALLPGEFNQSSMRMRLVVMPQRRVVPSLRKGATVVEESAAAVADGNLPAGVWAWSHRPVPHEEWICLSLCRDWADGRCFSSLRMWPLSLAHAITFDYGEGSSRRCSHEFRVSWAARNSCGLELDACWWLPCTACRWSFSAADGGEPASFFGWAMWQLAPYNLPAGLPG